MTQTEICSKVLRNLYFFSRKVRDNEDLFRQIFGQVGTHLYNKLEGYNFDVLYWLPDLDGNNMAKLAEYLQSQRL